MMKEEIEKSIEESYKTIQKIADLSNDIELVIQKIVFALKNKHKIILFGNGGSAADAQHIAAEMIGRFKLERDSYPAIALTTDSSILTSLSNDYSFDIVFSRQCEALVNPNDVVIGISTSGKSINVLSALEISHDKGATTALLTGSSVSSNNFIDFVIPVPSTDTARIQEGHRVIIHILCEFIEKHFANKT